MSNKQQTAVQWLKAQLAVTHSPEIIEWLWTKAFQMEKEQIEIAFRSGHKTSKSPREYFTDTYQTNK